MLAREGLFTCLDTCKSTNHHLLVCHSFKLESDYSWDHRECSVPLSSMEAFISWLEPSPSTGWPEVTVHYKHLAQ